MLNSFSWYHPPKKKSPPTIFIPNFEVPTSLSLSHPPTTETPRIALAFGAPRGWHSTMCDHRVNREERNREKCRPCLEQSMRNPSDLGTWLGLLETSRTAATNIVTNMTSIFGGVGEPKGIVVSSWRCFSTEVAFAAVPYFSVSFQRNFARWSVDVLQG